MQPLARNYTIDALRLLASFFVVVIHVKYGNAVKTVVDILLLSTRWAVPFFFLVSGYFYQKSLITNGAAALKSNFNKILGVVVVANLVYVPAVYIATRHFYRWDYLVVGDSFHLWFLHSLLLGIMVVYLFHKIKLSAVVTGAIALLIIGLSVYENYRYCLEGDKLFFYNFYVRCFQSIPFMLIGGYFYNNTQFKRFLKPAYGLGLLIGGFILQMVELAIINSNAASTVHEQPSFLTATSLYAIGIFIVALSVNWHDNVLSRLGKKYSLFIYLYHPVPLYALTLVKYDRLFSGTMLLFFPIVVFAITLAVAALLNSFVQPLFLLLNGSVKEALYASKMRQVKTVGPRQNSAA